MKLNSQIVNLILNGQYEKAHELWKRTIHKVIRADPEQWTYPLFNNIYSTCEFVLNFDPFVRGAVNKRMHLLKAYNQQVKGNEYLEAIVIEHRETFYKILYNVIFLGKCLIEIDDSKIGFKIKIIPPQEYYVDDGEIIFITKTNYNKNNLLFFGNEFFDISAISLSIVPYSISKEENYTLWLENNKYLNGFIHSKVSPEVAHPTSTAEQTGLVIWHDKIANEVENLAATGGTLSTPTGVEIEHKDVVNTGVGISYLTYINQVRTEIENIILGRGTQERDIAYASEKIRYLSTADIQFTDVNTIEHIVNTVLVYIKWRRGIQDISSEFKVIVEAQKDELNVIQLLNGIKSLDGVDPEGNPPRLDFKWLSETTRIPFLNQGEFILQGTTPPDTPTEIEDDTTRTRKRERGKKRICQRCGAEYIASKPFQKLCDTCKKAT